LRFLTVAIVEAVSVIAFQISWLFLAELAALDLLPILTYDQDGAAFHPVQKLSLY
jgi:hypothetical protein